MPVSGWGVEQGGGKRAKAWGIVCQPPSPHSTVGRVPLSSLDGVAEGNAFGYPTILGRSLALRILT